MWRPFASRAPRPPCEACGSINYLHPHDNGEGYVVCTLDCYYSMRWRRRFNYLGDTTVRFTGRRAR